MASLPENMSVAIDELEAAITEMESRLESAHAERDEAKARQVELEIENANLRRVLTLARERQGASAEILEGIANLSGDADQLLHLIAETTARLFGAPSVTIRLADGEHWGKSIRFGASSQRIHAEVPSEQRRLSGENLPGTVYRENRQIHIPDLDNVDPAMAHWPVMAARAEGTRTVAGTPLRREGKAIGALLVFRDGLAPFTDDELALQQSFADQAVIAIENARLFNETREALERQTATADILKVIASSPSDVQPVFDTIAESARRLCGGHTSIVTQVIGDFLHLGASSAASEAGAEELRASFPIPISASRLHGRAALNGEIAFRYDTENEPDVTPAAKETARVRGYRSLLAIPMMREGVAIGTIGVSRREAGHFPDKFIELLRTFADQAVIAIENARLIRETQEALERQTATADVLKVIASSPSDVQPVFAAIASSAKRLLDGFTATVLHFRGDQLHLVAFTPRSPEADQGLQASFPQPVAEFPIFGLVRDGATIQFPDTEADGVPAMNRDLGRLRGFRSVLFVPLMNQGKAVGILSVTRTEPGAFADHHVQLLQTFADQAVIAIENTRLFNETQEALERQTATADILKVIASSPSDTQPVFEAIAHSAKRLVGGFSTGVYRVVDDVVHLAAFTPTSPEADEALKAGFPLHRTEVPALLLVQDGETAQIADSETADPHTRKLGRARGWRSVTFAPLMSHGVFIGFIVCTRRETGLLADHHVQLLRTFADQAVIAIENTRLFNETEEALERQTATADILKVIASSPSDTTPVFEAIAGSAKRLLDAFSTAVFRFLDGNVYLAALTSVHPIADEAGRADFPRPVDEFPPFRQAQHGEPFAIPDTEQTPHEGIRQVARLHGFRSMLYVPLMSGSVPIGVITATRAEPGAFAPHHVQLLQTFADQAVIAIENTRLFNETKEALERQTATADILKVIASSPSDVQPVFDAIAASAKRLLGGFSSASWRFVDGMVHLAAITPTTTAADDALRAAFPRPIDEFVAFRLGPLGEPAIIPDTEDLAHLPIIRERARERGYRSALFVPLMNGGVPIGTLSVTRAEPGAFADHHVQLLQTFADQAVIAIENARLFNETQEALERQTATADILKVIASSPSDVQPVFDTIVHSANRLIGGFSTAVFRYGDGKIHLAAFTPTDAEGDAFLQSSFPVPLGQFPPYQLTREGAPAELPDTELEPAARDIARARGYRSMLFAPLMNEGEAVGIITVTRVAPGPFGEQHTRLLQMFADQAVIAIKNVGLFNEVQARTEDLAESLQQQTAVGDVLKTISRSTFELQPVLDTLVNSAQQLCDADMAFIMRRVGDEYRAGAAVGYTQAYIDFLTNHPLAVNRGTVTGRAVLERRPVQIPDVVADPEYTLHETTILAGQRTTVGVPLLRENEPIGVIVLARQRVEPFTQKQIDLVATFADQAVIAIENVRLFNETREALERQTATSDILKVIASSPSDVQPVFDVIVERAVQLCGARIGRVYRYDGELIHLVGGHGLSVPGREGAQRPFPRPASDDTIVGRVMLSRAPFILADLNEDDSVPPLSRQMITAIGARSQVTMPMLLAGQPIGAITLSWAEPRGYTDQQIALLRTFADQAVIAIENTRLFNEVQQRTEDLSEALQQQTATADVLKVISRSAFDLATVLDALLSSACRLCEADIGTIRYREGGEFRLAATFGCKPEWIEQLRRYSTKPDRSSVFGRTIVEGHTVHIPDLLADPDFDRPEAQKLMGIRAALGVPLVREGEAFGVISLFRCKVSSFEDRQIELVQTFADQAVIAIENVRLFDEVQARTRELSEALTYQTGSANILKVIASTPTDVEPSLKAIVESACELCEAYDAVVVLEDGEYLRFGAHHGPIPMSIEKWPINRRWTAGRAFVDKKPVHVPDLLAEGDEFPDGRELSQRMGHRTILSVPLLRENESIGAIVLRRTEVNPFTDKQISLLQTFADQAVIAIGNVRLFEEVQAKSRDLSEALTYQTGSANILKVIASSPTDIKPVLDAIVESACELCGAYDAVLRLKESDELKLAAHHGPVPADWQLVQINPYWTAGRAALERRPVHVHDMSSSEGDEFPQAQARALDQGHRTILSVPLLQEGNCTGTLTLRRFEVDPFAEKQITLLQTFADQAVIAIGNVRLFEEVQARTRELSESLQFQTASSDVLKVISSSPDALQPVLDAIVETSRELCGSDGATIVLFRDRKAYFAAVAGPPPRHFELLRDNPGSIDEPNSIFERMVRQKRTLHLPNVMDDPEISRTRAAMGGPRALLVAPLLRDGEPVGAIVLRQSHLKPFTPRQIQAIEVFADQAVIAISNVELFEQVQQRTRELSESLEQQTATSEVLSVISRSAGDLAPVFDTMLRKAMELCGGNFGTLNTYDGNRFQTAATYGLPPAYDEYRRKQPPQDYGPGTAPAILLKGEPHVESYGLIDSESYRRGDPNRRALVDIGGARCLLAVPLLRDERVVGSVMIFRQEDRPFSEKQITLLKQFAAQAVIAIENARLLNELRQRTDDLGESLQQQTATADVLQIISSSPGDLAPVFEKMLVNATRVCGAKFGSMLLAENGSLRPGAQYNVPAAFAAVRGNRVLTPHPKSALATAISTKQVVHVADMRTTEAYLERSPASIEIVELGGARTAAIVPMLRDDEVIGAITVYRNEVQLFSDKQIELLSNFAKQAVIAIENARLLKELRQRTDDLSQSLHELRTAQDRLVQTEKLASLGQLTAGIAHEIKNPLNFVNNFAALSAELTQELKEVLKPAGIGDKMRAEVNELTGLLKDNLEKVVQHGKRADSIVKNMLLHSREGGGEHRPSDINALVDESLNLAYHGARAEKPGFNVTLERDFDPTAGQVDLFPQEITRVLLNLISNGFYAVTKRSKEHGAPGFEPTLRASTKNLGESVEIRIRDNGTGIPAEVKEKMFNPFFTTKPAGEGTGLGLSMSHDIIVKQHGGTIDVDTSAGHFTEFRIVLPRTSNFAEKSRG
jgi:GAF domain-containing protein